MVMLSIEKKSMPNACSQNQENSREEVFTFSDETQNCLLPGLNLNYCRLSHQKKKESCSNLFKNMAMCSLKVVLMLVIVLRGHIR